MREKHRILIVDDNPTNERILRLMLRSYDLRCARSGVEALGIAHDFEPDLVLLDVMMPGMDGYEVCRRMRTDPRLRLTKIVMVSAKAMLEERLQGYDVGADDYVTKPFDLEELKAKVQVHLRLKFAEELGQLKSDFLGLMCHETRTPLSHVLAPAEMLASQEPMSDEDRRMWADVLLRGAQRIHRMHEKILHLCALRSGALEFRRDAADLTQLARASLRTVTEAAAERSVRLELDLVTEAPIWADGSQLLGAIGALLDNAVRFSPVGGLVRVVVVDRGAEVCLRVIDAGPGIPLQHLPRVFEEFTCADPAHHSKGLGLSLAIARRIVRAHGGEISVVLPEEGGTVFEILLPRASSSTEAARA